MAAEALQWYRETLAFVSKQQEEALQDVTTVLTSLCLNSPSSSYHRCKLLRSSQNCPAGGFTLPIAVSSAPTRVHHKRCTLGPLTSQMQLLLEPGGNRL